MTDWNKLSPLPHVAPWNKGRKSRTWEHRRDEYAALPKRPLLILARLATPILHAETGQTHLDGPLSAAALTLHPVASDWQGAAVVPLPLELAWVSPGGQPLWACTPLTPAGPAVDSMEYMHKRYPGHRADFASKQSADTKTGRWKEYRIPLHAQSVDTLAALCIGHADAVRELLGALSHLGDETGRGYGRVARWDVIEAEHTLEDVLARRAVPAGYYEGRQPVGVYAPLRGWTPPYWYAPWWGPCMLPAAPAAKAA